MTSLDPTAGPFHAPEQIAAWLQTLAVLHEEHKRDPEKVAQIEACQEQAWGWLRARRDRKHLARRQEGPVRPRSERKPRPKPPRVLRPTFPEQEGSGLSPRE